MERSIDCNDDNKYIEKEEEARKETTQDIITIIVKNKVFKVKKKTKTLKP